MPSGHKGVKWDQVPLGSKPDTVFAKEFNVAPQVVARARDRRGIAPLIPRQKVTGDKWDSCDLGEKPDSEIARALGVARETVGKARRKRGIPAFVGLILRQDGTPCRSIYEAMYDAVLHHRVVQHDHEVPLKDLGIIADLVVEGTVVEIAGMDGFPRYDERRTRKEEIYSKAGISVTWLTREHVLDAYRDVPLAIGTRERFCSNCGTQTIDLVRGTCRPCHIKSWRSETAITVVCKSCSQPYERAAADTNRKFCSRNCYWNSLKLDLPPQEEIDLLIAETGNTSKVAQMFGVRPATLHQRRYRQRQRATSPEMEG